MKNIIYLVTSNPGKVESFTKILSQYNFPVTIEMLNAEYIENKDLGTTEGVVIDGAKICAEKYNKPVLVQDSGLFVDHLNGFPGVNTKFVLSRIGNEGIIKLMQGVKNRRCRWIFSLGYCEPGGVPVCFNGEVEGNVSETLQGDDGFGFDSLFIPLGYSSTFAQNTKLRDKLSPFHTTVKSAINFIIKV